MFGPIWSIEQQIDHLARIEVELLRDDIEREIEWIEAELVRKMNSGK
jgi:hypothetical protein